MARRNPDLMDALKLTLRQLEQSEQFSPSDPTLLRLKRSILLTIAKLESREPDGNGDDTAAA